jgi:hypothetical protein
MLKGVKLPKATEIMDRIIYSYIEQLFSKKVSLTETLVEKMVNDEVCSHGYHNLLS